MAVRRNLLAMATTDSLIALNDTAIEGLYAALADESMESYTTPDGSSYKRASFPALLKSLLDARELLTAAKRRETRATSKRVHLGSLGFSRRSK